MNILFLTLGQIYDFKQSDIYTDLMECFVQHGHQVIIVSPYERRMGKNTEFYEADGAKFLVVKTLNIQKTNIIEKGLGTLLIGWQYKRAIKKYLGKEKIDLVTYSTPPITLASVVKYVKGRYGAKSYLQLKDIFPQNAVDIGMMKEESFICRFFRKKERELYNISDFIGCMSPANVKYVVEHNPEVDPAKVEVAPNSVELRVESLESIDKLKVREKYGLPIDKPVFIYGGNLGKPQGIPFLMKCLKANAKRTDCHFVVIGSGTELPRLKAWYDNLNANLNENDNENSKPSTVNGKLNITVMEGLPKADYDELVQACDVGLIFLDHRFTIPNFPSRLLSYLENGMPVLCAIDPNCDMGRIAEENGFGFWCESNSVEAFTVILDKMIAADRQTMGEKGYEFLKANYTVENTYNAIMGHF